MAPRTVAACLAAWSAPDWVLQALQWIEMDTWTALHALSTLPEREPLVVASLSDALVPPGMVQEALPVIDRLVSMSGPLALRERLATSQFLQTRLAQPARANPSPSPAPNAHMPVQPASSATLAPAVKKLAPPPPFRAPAQKRPSKPPRRKRRCPSGEGPGQVV